MLTKYSKCNSFQVRTDLRNSNTLKIAIAELRFYYVIADPKVGEQHI